MDLKCAFVGCLNDDLWGMLTSLSVHLQTSFISRLPPGSFQTLVTCADPFHEAKFLRVTVFGAGRCQEGQAKTQHSRMCGSTIGKPQESLRP